MPKNEGRSGFLQSNPNATAWAALDDATNQQKNITPGAIKIPKDKFKGKRAIILGAGVAGLTTAYELLAQESGMAVTVLEAHNRTGGRCLSLRTGDTLTEDVDSELFDSSPGETQTIRFKHPVGDSEPYLNAGPGRIPSGHKRLLSYLKRFGVAVEVYVMNSDSNLIQMDDGPFKGEPVVYRRLDHNTRGWLAHMVWNNAESLLNSCKTEIAPNDLKERVAQLQSLMVSFGELTPTGDYVPNEGDNGFENARSRGGFKKLPGVDAGEIADALSLDTLLESEFWKNTRFYQPVDFLWQQTLFQPVGGMDQVQRAFARQVASLGGNVHLNSPVTRVEWDAATHEFVVHVSQIGSDKTITYRGDYCFSNIAIPFLKKILSQDLQGNSSASLDRNFKQGLEVVYQTQFAPAKIAKGHTSRFLACTTKVGWQADRALWQGSPISEITDSSSGETILNVPDSEIGVVPIFGGISWTQDEIVQIWYPSNAYHDQKGVLTGAYNFSHVAEQWGKKSANERLKMARTSAKKFGKAFGEGLHDGVAIAWQNIPYIKGGWAQWQAVTDKDAAVTTFNDLSQGSGVGDPAKPVFFIIGDQLSSLPGWQEGAIASALNALSRMNRPDLEIQHLSALPDTRLMVEGI